MQPFTALACDPSHATETSLDAEVVRGLKGSAEAIAHQIASSVGDPVTGAGSQVEDSPNMGWPTAHGRVVVQMSRPSVGNASADPGDFLAAYYEGDRKLEAPQVLSFAKALGADPSTLKSGKSGSDGGEVWQEWDGMRLQWQTAGQLGASWHAGGTGSRLGIGPVYTFQASGAKVTAEEANATARTFLRCSLDAQGHTDAKGYRLEKSRSLGASVVNRTVTLLVDVQFATPDKSPCGTWDVRWIYVDAWTGAVRESALAPCL